VEDPKYHCGKVKLNTNDGFAVASFVDDWLSSLATQGYIMFGVDVPKFVSLYFAIRKNGF